jgi:hypothetical protein
MSKIEIGVGFVVAALAGFGLLQNIPTSIVLTIIGIGLIFHGSYEVFFKPHMFLERRLKRWLEVRHWSIRIEKDQHFYFVIWAEDESHRKIAISRHRNDKGVLAFTALVNQTGKTWEPKLDVLTGKQRTQLIEDIRVFFASKDMGYDGADWPFDKLTVQSALPLDSQLSEHLVDLKAKEVVNAIIGVRSLIRRAIVPQWLESHK